MEIWECCGFVSRQLVRWWLILKGKDVSWRKTFVGRIIIRFLTWEALKP